MRAAWMLGAVLGLLGALAWAQPTTPGSRRIVAEIVNFESNEGVAIVSLFDQPDSWLKPERALRSGQHRIQDGRVQVVFEGLSPGSYAVAVIHDLDGNGELTMVWFPYPHLGEQAGTSLNPKALFGPPDFEDAAFAVGAKDVTLTIRMKK